MVPSEVDPCPSIKSLKWHPTMDEAVNKPFLSTGESGEFASENAGSGLNPGVERALRRGLSSNWRERKRVRTCGMWQIRVKSAAGAAVNKTGDWSWGKKGLAPQPEFELWLTASGFQNKSLSFYFDRILTTAMNGVTNLEPNGRVEAY